MIEIIYGHKRKNTELIQKKITIGHGVICPSQIDFISHITEYIDMETGIINWANMNWGFGLWRITRKIKRKFKND